MTYGINTYFSQQPRNRYLSKALTLANINTKIINPEAEFFYSEEEGKGWRQINQPVELNIIGKERAFPWIDDNKGHILEFFQQNPDSKGAIILNSIAIVKRVVKLLSKYFENANITVAENTSLTNPKERKQSLKRRFNCWYFDIRCRN